MTKIEWANESWNPITGCTPISEGCANCYAKRMSKRLAGRFGYPAKEPFSVTLHEDILSKPFEWKLPKTIFVCSMGDIFHPDVPDEWIDRVFSVMTEAYWHTYLVLTKRPERMRKYLCGLYDDDEIAMCHGVPFRNVWCGVTAENQARANERIPVLLTTPAVKRFVSVEPMLSDIRLHHSWARLDWVICGAETGPGMRPMENAWAESLRDQCNEAKIPFFFKKDSQGQGRLGGTEWYEMPYMAENEQEGGVASDA